MDKELSVWIEVMASVFVLVMLIAILALAIACLVTWLTKKGWLE